MKGILANLLIKLGLDSKEFEKGVDNAKQKTNAFAAGMKQIGGMIAGAFAVGAIANFAKQIFALANESIKVENELSAAIKANGKEVKTTMAAYKAFANEMQNKTTVDDESVLSALRLAETLQSDAPMEAAKNAIALSKAIGVDLNTAVKMAVMAQSDMYTMLSRYVPALRDAQTETERLTEYNKLLASGQQMLTDELETAQGKIIQNQNAWDNVKESWGTLISESSLLSFVLKKINDDLAISNSSLKWYEKWWFRATLQHGKGAEKARELAAAEAEAANKAAENANSFKNLIGEVKAYGDTVETAKKKREEAFKSWDAENEKIQKQIELLEMVDETKRKAISSITGKAVNPEDLKPSVSSGEVTGEFGSLFQKFGLSEEKESDIGFDTEAYQKKLEQFNQFKEDMAFAVADFGVNVVEEFGQSIGEMIASGNFDFSNFGKTILAGIGGFISQLGKMLIGLGIASEAFQALLKSAFTNPVSAGLAIAAGAALVLLGGAIQGAAKAGPNGASSSGSVSAPSYSHAGSPSSGYRAEDNKVVFEIKGDKLVGVLSNVQRKNLNMA